MQEEGYIKFNAHWNPTLAFSNKKIAALNNWRKKLYELHFLGAYPDGIGYGNVSQRAAKETFFISGSKTGNLNTLTAEHYSKVIGFDISRNEIKCEGPIVASSESMSHAVIYQELDWVNAVFHVHDYELWKAVLHKIPTTDVTAEYGTPEMAKEIIRKIRESNVIETRVFAMAGHQEGLIAFGRTLDDAGKSLIELKEASK
ncbi:MAG: L-ribulose-5-phosphate 4-epimerase [Polaribacter sp.]|jgi:L-ribulose-5-phosphate 4-epimerase